MIKIGLVLAKSPEYSETFFNSKIKGLQESGNQVLLFTNSESVEYRFCEHRKSPKFSRVFIIQLLNFFLVIIKLIPHTKAVFNYIKLEIQDGTKWKKIIKKIYLNSSLLSFKGDWLHFGFGTMALDKELIAQAIGAKMAVSFRGFDIAIYPLKNPGCYNKLWNKVTKIHVISDDIADLLYKNGFKNQVPIVKITPAIDVKYFSKSKAMQFNSPIRFLSIARLHWKKGIVSTLEALFALKQRGYDFVYNIIGSGVEYERIKFTIADLGLEKHVNLLGQLNKCEVKNWYENSTIYLQYSISEGFCNAVLEAQAMGLLCIVSDAEGLSENVQNGHTGWIVPRDDENKLVEIIENTLTLDDDIKIEVSNKAVQRVRENYSLLKQKEEFLSFYTENL